LISPPNIDGIELLNKFRENVSNKRILVVGDLLLDQYLLGAVERISPEAPVPIFHLEDDYFVGGGAANVAANIQNLGISTIVVGFVGDDKEMHLLREIMATRGIDSSSLIAVPDWSTITKTRVVSDHQHMLRIDKEKPIPESDKSDKRLTTEVQNHLNTGVDVVILSDYNKGVLSESTTQAIIKLARQYETPVLVDPKGQDFGKYRGAECITPNRKEFLLASDSESEDLDGLIQDAETFRSKYGWPRLIVTLGESGMAAIDKDGSQIISAVAKEVFDVSGAGDTVIAMLGACKAAGLDNYASAYLANLASGIVIGYVGTSPITLPGLITAIQKSNAWSHSENIDSINTLSEKSRWWKSHGERVVFTNGCFDLLHPGHLHLLEQAREFGDRLIIGLNTDQSIKRLKGESRPVLDEQHRARLLSALSVVDSVVLFDEDTPINLITTLQPDVIVKGGDYVDNDVVGFNECSAWGGRVEIVPLLKGFSTTGLAAQYAANRTT
jgi:D-beta-D-heptose 7-phosphate kinase/D-beta-D-heptose 1-phosphate adenosyltransferase